MAKLDAFAEANGIRENSPQLWAEVYDSCNDKQKGLLWEFHTTAKDYLFKRHLAMHARSLTPDHAASLMETGYRHELLGNPHVPEHIRVALALSE